MIKKATPFSFTRTHTLSLSLSLLLQVSPSLTHDTHDTHKHTTTRSFALFCLAADFGLDAGLLLKLNRLLNIVGASLCPVLLTIRVYPLR